MLNSSIRLVLSVLVGFISAGAQDMTARASRPFSGAAPLRCTGDGRADDTKCVQDGVNAASGGVLEVPSPPGCYRMTAGVSISSPIRIHGRTSKVCMDIPLSATSRVGRVFDISSSNVTIEGLWIDG